MGDGGVEIDLTVEIRLPIALQQRLIIAPPSVGEAVRVGRRRTLRASLDLSLRSRGCTADRFSSVVEQQRVPQGSGNGLLQATAFPVDGFLNSSGQHMR